MLTISAHILRPIPERANQVQWQSFKTGLIVEVPSFIWFYILVVLAHLHSSIISGFHTWRVSIHKHLLKTNQSTYMAITWYEHSYILTSHGKINDGCVISVVVTIWWSEDKGIGWVPTCIHLFSYSKQEIWISCSYMMCSA